MINGKVFADTEPLGVTTGETLRIRLVNAGQLAPPCTCTATGSS